MATILEFRPGQRAQHVQSRPHSSGEVVLFPGIRYEYEAPAAKAASKTRRRSPRKRDKLEIK